MREIKSDADPGVRLFVSHSLPTAAGVRLVAEGWSSSAYAEINLDVAVRRELIEALIATLPVDEYIDIYRQWRREVGVPVPGDES